MNRISMEWKTVCSVDKLKNGSHESFEIDGKKFLVSRIDDKYYAIDGLCSHMGGDLGKGKTENNNVICPKHHAVFNLENGHVEKNINGFFRAMTRKEAKDLHAYEIREENGNIEIGI
ncbi:Rieske (2Fe-2S) protein [Ferroplasma sp.]|uniref:Rieske (2Fe-2S) protein n=1 Tax=Ferroplasma sp. TaxID=2591003 RepID=UPI002638F215|nr:Rieske (2Fe-2S) protein [Ferroplasma sp.]MCL4453688.1 Rieske (2Fe-2S) protein [Candidatus Thermoplasmatota archaeon]